MSISLHVIAGFGLTMCLMCREVHRNWQLALSMYTYVSIPKCFDKAPKDMQMKMKSELCNDLNHDSCCHINNMSIHVTVKLFQISH